MLFIDKSAYAALYLSLGRKNKTKASDLPLCKRRRSMEIWRWREMSVQYVLKNIVVPACQHLYTENILCRLGDIAIINYLTNTSWYIQFSQTFQLLTAVLFSGIVQKNKATRAVLNMDNGGMQEIPLKLGRPKKVISKNTIIKAVKKDDSI